jgi:hypothetical protein
MLLQDAPPDTSGYMIAGYAVFFVISAIYLLSLIVRQRNLEQDLETLEAIHAESGRDSGRAGASGPARTSAGSSRPAPARRKQVRKKVTRRK